MFEYIISKCVDPFRNLATEQILMRHADDRCFLFLWQNENTIVVGRNQNIESECKVDEFLRQGGRIARRKSGGGAVYHDLGNLNFSVICRLEDKEKFSYQNIVKDALIQFDIKPIFNGRNDLLINNCKFSGNAMYIEKDIICQHGTILISTDIDKMCYFLTPDISKLRRNHVKSIYSRVINLSTIYPNITVKNMTQAMIEAIDAKQSKLIIDKTIVDEEESLLKSEKWLYGGKR